MRDTRAYVITCVFIGADLGSFARLFRALLDPLLRLNLAPSLMSTQPNPVTHLHGRYLKYVPAVASAPSTATAPAAASK